MAAPEGCFVAAVAETEVDSEEAVAWIVGASEGAGEEALGGPLDLLWSS